MSLCIAFFSIVVNINFSLANKDIYRFPALLTELSDNKIEIGSRKGFHGTRLTLFGNKNIDGKIAVVLMGSDVTKSVTKKFRNRFGIWFSGSSMIFKNVPSLYFLATVHDIESSFGSTAKNFQLGFANLNIFPTDFDKIKDQSLMLRDIYDGKMMIIKQQVRRKLFSQKQGFSKDAMESKYIFKFSFKIPENIRFGRYVVSTFLINDGVRAVNFDYINIIPSDLDFIIADLSIKNKGLYYFYCLGTAILMGCLSFIFFNLISIKKRKIVRSRMMILDRDM